MDTEKQVQKAATLLSRLREEDTDFRVFGADSHRYRIGPPLSEAEVRSFEIKHNIQLPDDHRLYLKTVGNGNGDTHPLLSYEGIYRKAGAGPHYGIYRLEDMALGQRTGEPFPYQEATLIEDDLVDRWDGDIPGLLDISTEGCSGNTHLVVQGATYGTVWYCWDSDNFLPTGVSFTEWSCDWAERCIPRVIQERITDTISEGMKLSQVLALCGSDGQRPYSLQRWHQDSPTRHLRFENLATCFEIGDDDTVTHVTRHSI